MNSISDTPESLRNLSPNLNGYNNNNNFSPYVNRGNIYSPQKNQEYINGSTKNDNDIQNYLHNQQVYNGYNSLMKDRLRMAGGNIMK